MPSLCAFHRPPCRKVSGTTHFFLTDKHAHVYAIRKSRFAGGNKGPVRGRTIRQPRRSTSCIFCRSRTGRGHSGQSWRRREWVWAPRLVPVRPGIAGSVAGGAGGVRVRAAQRAAHAAEAEQERNREEKQRQNLDDLPGPLPKEG